MPQTSNKFERHIGLSLPSVCLSSIRLSVPNAYRQLGNSRTALLVSLNFFRGMYMKIIRRPVFFFSAGPVVQKLCPFVDFFILYSNDLVNKIKNRYI